MLIQNTMISKLRLRTASVMVAFVAFVLPTVCHAAPSVTPRVIESYPHDTAAFTQGLLLFEGDFFESTGRYGESSLRRVDVESGEVMQRIENDAEEFGEGLARVGERLIQLTWQNQVAHAYDLQTFEEQRTFDYEGEGWGLCYDGKELFMSDGSAQLFVRDPDSFELVRQISVTDAGEPVTMLNELECVGDHVFANVWQADRIVRIEKATGDVSHEIDASGLLSEDEAATADVLNGIAHDAEWNRFFLTGKLWPRVFEVTLDFGDEANGGPREPNGCSCSAPGRSRSNGVLAGLVLLGLLRRDRSTPSERRGGAQREP